MDVVSEYGLEKWMVGLGWPSPEPQKMFHRAAFHICHQTGIFFRTTISGGIRCSGNLAHTACQEQWHGFFAVSGATALQQSALISDHLIHSRP